MPSLVSDYEVTVDEVEACVCPTCDAVAGQPCMSLGTYVETHHAKRVSKARSIARDLAVAGCLPEHDPEGYRAAMAVVHGRTR